MRKICFVLDQLQYGGIEKVFINYASCLNYKHDQIDVIILSNIEKMVEHIPKECNVIYKNVPRHHSPTSRSSAMIRRTGGALLYYPNFLLKKIFIYPLDYLKFRNIRKKKYDIAIAFSGHFNDIYCTLDLIKADKKIVWTHGMIYQYMLISPSFEKMYSKFDKIISINHLNQDDIFDCKPYLNYKIEKLYNPIIKKDLIADKKEVARLKKEYGKFILSVARLASPKDFITLLDAYNLLSKDLKNEYALVIVGDGPDRPKIEQYIEKLHLKNHVFLMGSQDQVANYYQAASLFVLSTKSEGLGMVIIEAMANGIPVIATDAPYGPRDILINDTGILCPVGDYRALAENMKKVLTCPEIREEYIKKGLERSKDFYSENIINQFYDILKN